MSESIKYHMNNVVNGRLITLAGGGELSDGGEMKIEVKISEVPAEWNGIVVPCICSGPGPGNGPEKPGGIQHKGPGGLIAFASNGYRTTPGTYRYATLYDEGGQAIAAIRATGVYARTSDGLDFSINVETNTTRGSILPQLKNVDHYSFTIHPDGPGRVHVYAHYSLSTPDKRKVYGWTNISYDMIDIVDPLPQPLVGRNHMQVEIIGNTLKYTSIQDTIPVTELGQIWSQ